MVLEVAGKNAGQLEDFRGSPRKKEATFDHHAVDGLYPLDWMREKV